MAVCASEELAQHQHSPSAPTAVTTTQGTEVPGRQMRWQEVAERRGAVAEEMQSGCFTCLPRHLPGHILQRRGGLGIGSEGWCTSV